MAARCTPTQYILTVGDTAPGTMTFVVTGGIADPTTATATYSSRDEDGYRVVNGATASIGSVTTDTDGTKGCTLSTTLTSTTTARAGTQYGQFRLAYPSGGGGDPTYLTVPSGNTLVIRVEPAYRSLSART